MAPKRTAYEQPDSSTPRNQTSERQSLKADEKEEEEEAYHELAQSVGSVGTGDQLLLTAFGTVRETLRETGNNSYNAA